MIKALRQKRADLVKEGDEIFKKATAENRNLTAEEAARDDAIAAELTEVDANIARAERQMDRQRQIDPRADANVQADEGDAQGRVVSGKKFASLGEQMMAVVKAEHPSMRGQADPRLVPYAGPTGMSEGINSDGGFLVQTDFVPGLLEGVFSGGEIAKRITKLPIGPNSNGIAMNGVDETSRANGSRWGGIRAYWSGEASLINASQPKFRKVKMDLDKLTGLCYATDELLADATALEAWLKMAFTDEFTFKVEDAVMNGSGAGMPLGFLNGPATITVTKEGSQAAATIVSENILKMWARMPARLRQNCVWLINQDCEPQLLQLNLKVKNVAATENVGGLPLPAVIYEAPSSKNPFGLLMGRPVIPVEYAATLGTAGDISLVDLSQYLGIDKGGVQQASSIHVRFLYDETAFRFIYRFNGQPLWNAALTPYKGSSTQSPFIILQTR